MQATEDTQETPQKSTHAYKDAHTRWLSCLVPVAVVRVGSNALMLTQCFPATLHMTTLC